MATAWTCSDCQAVNSVTGRFCEACGSPRSEAASGSSRPEDRRDAAPAMPATSKCSACKVGEAERRYGGKCVTCGRCHGKAERGRCTFRAEAWDGGRTGFCGWHHRVRHDDQANTFAEFEKWQAILAKGQYCDRWTHFTASELWDGMAGERSSRVTAKSCGGGDCPHRPENPDGTPARIAVTPKAPPPIVLTDAEREQRLRMLQAQAQQMLEGTQR